MPALNSTKVILQTRWLAVILAGVTFLLFAPAMDYDYVDYDDGVYVYGNKEVLKGLTAGSVGYAFTTIAGGSWMPLTWFSHMLDVTLAGPAPRGPHTTNVLLHALNAGVLLLVLQRMTGQLWLAGFVAAVFAFHPLRNESVAWVSERKDVLSTLLLLLGLLAYVRYVEQPGSKRLAVVAVCLGLGLMAKPMLVTFPFLLLLLDFWPLQRLGGDWLSFQTRLRVCLLEKLPLFLLVAIFCIATYWAQYHYGAVNRAEFSFSERVTQVAGNYWFYVKKFFVPTQLNALHPELKTSPTEALLILSGLAAVTAVVVWRGFRQPWLALGWFWFLGTLVPVVGIVRIGHISVAERYSYIPTVGLTIVIAWQLAAWVQGRRWATRLAGIGAGLTLTACALATRADLPRWQNSFSLFESSIWTSPHPVAYHNLGAAYLDRRQYELAIEPLSRAIALDPRYVKAYINRITAYQHTGRQAEARADLVEMVKVEPRNAEGYNSRADVLLDLMRYDEAIADFTAAIKLAPQSANSYNNRATARFMKGDYVAAREDCMQAIKLNPRYGNAFNNLGNICNRLGDLPQALTNYTKAIALAPGDPLAYNNRAAVYYALKQYDRAWADLRACEAVGGTPHAGLVQALRQASVPR